MYSKKRLDLSGFKLRTLLSVTQAINNNASKEELLAFFPKLLGENLHIGKILLYTNNNGWHCEIAYNVNESQTGINIEEHLLSYTNICMTRKSNIEALKQFDLLIPVYHKQKALAYLLLGDLDEERIEVSPLIKHYTFIQTLANIIMVAIENKKLYKENLEQVAVNRELELASKVQKMLFPSVLPDTENFKCAVHYKPHQLIGGDYYDVILTDKDEYVFCIADVSGKGISASLIMSNFQAALRVLLPYIHSLPELLFALNKGVFENTKGEKFITLFIARYNTKSREMEYVNAGHIPPLFYANNKISFLEDGGIMLGAFYELPELKVGKVNVPVHSSLFCYTDGLLELENENGVQFGIENTCKSFAKNTDLLPDQIVDNIFADAENFRGNKSYNDDLTLFACRF